MHLDGFHIVECGGSAPTLGSTIIEGQGTIVRHLGLHIEAANRHKPTKMNIRVHVLIDDVFSLFISDMQYALSCGSCTLPTE